MKLTCSVLSPPPRPRLRWLVVAPLLVATGVVGQRVADAIADASRTTSARASADYEMWMMLDVVASRHVGSASCSTALAELHASGSELRDPWEHPYVTSCTMDGGHAVLFIVSAGPDCVLGTPDDVVASQPVLP